jgi:hypothetical protein
VTWAPPPCACGQPAVAWRDNGAVGHCNDCIERLRPTLRLPYQPGSATSRAAAESARFSAAEQRARVADFYRTQAPGGATREEAAIRLGLPIQSICPRVRELIGDGTGVLVESDETRLTRAGKPAAVLYWRDAIDIGL